MGLSRIRHVVAGALAAGVALSPAHANPCINRVDLGVDLNWGLSQISGAPPVFNFRSAFDAGTGQTIVAGVVRNPDPSATVPIFKMWSWDGFAWTERDVGPLLAQLPPTALPFDVRSIAIDPVSRTAIMTYLFTSSSTISVAFNIDDFNAPLLSLGDPNDTTSAARSIAAVFAPDDGRFYLFNRTNGIRRFEPVTGTVETMTQGPALIPQVSQADYVYDADERRIVVFVNGTSGHRTWIYSLDDNTLVETTDPSTAPPVDGAFYRLVSAPSSGAVYLASFRSTANLSLPDDRLLRLVGDSDWTTIDARFQWLEDEFWSRPPSVVYDERAGQIFLAGGTLVGLDRENYRTLAAVIDAPGFAAPPTSVTVPQGNPVSLVALPTAHSFYSSVVWRKNGQVLTATGIPALLIPNATPADTGVYSVELVGVCGNTMSQEFTLTVTCPGDTDANGVINFSDLNSVLTRFGQTCH